MLKNKNFVGRKIWHYFYHYHSCTYLIELCYMTRKQNMRIGTNSIWQMLICVIGQKTWLEKRRERERVCLTKNKALTKTVVNVTKIVSYSP